MRKRSREKKIEENRKRKGKKKKKNCYVWNDITVTELHIMLHVIHFK